MRHDHHPNSDKGSRNSEQAGRIGESFSRENQPDARGGEERGYQAPTGQLPGWRVTPPTGQKRSVLGSESTEFALGQAVFAVLVKHLGRNVKQAVTSVDLGMRRHLNIEEQVVIEAVTSMGAGRPEAVGINGVSRKADLQRLGGDCSKSCP